MGQTLALSIEWNDTKNEEELLLRNTLINSKPVAVENTGSAEKGP
jgi:hypothetical protein